jgi:hypothetical protein
VGIDHADAVAVAVEGDPESAFSAFTFSFNWTSSSRLSVGMVGREGAVVVSLMMTWRRAGVDHAAQHLARRGRCRIPHDVLRRPKSMPSSRRST